MAKYDPNQVCQNCRQYVDGYVQTREAEISQAIGKAKAALTVYNHLMEGEGPAAEYAHAVVKASMEGKPIPKPAGAQESQEPTKGTIAPEIDDRLSEIEYRQQLKDLKETYPHLTKEQLGKIRAGYTEDGAMDAVPLEQMAWIVLKNEMLPPAKQRETAQPYAPAQGDEPEAGSPPQKFKDNTPTGARREVDAAIERDFAELLQNKG